MKETTEQRIIIILLMTLLVQSLFLCIALLLAMEPATPDEYLQTRPTAQNLSEKIFPLSGLCLTN